MEYHAACAKQETLYVLPESLMEILGVEMFHQLSAPLEQEQDYAFTNTPVKVRPAPQPQQPQTKPVAPVADDDMPF